MNLQRAPFPLASSRITITSRSEVLGRLASSGSQFVEPAVYAAQNPGRARPSSTIHCRAASLACLMVTLHPACLIDPPLSTKAAGSFCGLTQFKLSARHLGASMVHDAPIALSIPVERPDLFVESDSGIRLFIRGVVLRKARTGTPEDRSCCCMGHASWPAVLRSLRQKRAVHG